MKKIMKKIMMVFTACAVMVLGAVSLASAVPFNLNQITINGAEDSVPQISKNGDTVWIGVGNKGYKDIYVLDGLTGQTRALTDQTATNDHPRINDRGDIVWSKYDTTDLDWVIMLYTKATNTIQRLSLPKNPLQIHNDQNPQINNLGHVVYSSLNGGPDIDIMFYDGVSVTQVNLNDTIDEDFPALNDKDDIVWLQGQNLLYHDVYLRDGVSKSIIPIDISTYNHMAPEINNPGDIVYGRTNGTNFQLYYYKRIGGVTTPITSDSTDNEFVQFNNSGQMTWVKMTTNDGEIYFQNGQSGTPQNISQNSAKDDGSPCLNDNGWVAWDEDQGTTGTNDQTFLWDGQLPAWPSHVTRLVTDAYDHIWPAINTYNYVVWQGTGGTGTTLTDYEIFTAVTGSCVGVVCNDNNPCTTNACNPATGTCVYTPIVCNDNNACTADTCNPSSGCVYTPLNCDDNNVCTADTCNTATGCVHTLFVCTDGNLCTTDTCDPVRGCVYVPLPAIDDHNACTVDYCNPAIGAGSITHTPLVCNDNNICTIDSCNTATGCVTTPKCNDNNLCTVDTCNTSTGACSYPAVVCNDNNICTTDTCSTTTGQCVYTLNNTICPSTTGNNFTMLDQVNNVVGGTNDILFAWDGTKKTSVAVSGQISNALLTSSCIYSSSFWKAHDLAVYSAGTYTVYTACPAGSPGCGKTSDSTGVDCPVGSTCPPITFTVKTGEIGIHMLFDWGGNTNIDVVNILKPNAMFGPSPMATSGQYVCGSNPSCTVWGWDSYDADGDGINGIRMVDGPLPGFSPNFNFNKVTPVDLCCDAVTRCNDNNACTIDSCDSATGNCINTPKVCMMPGSVCNSAVGCLPSGGVNTKGNNLSILLSNGQIVGGTNDVKFTWDGTLQSAATFSHGDPNAPSNATISSDEPFQSWLWYAKHVQVVGPGTYWVDLDGGGPGTNRYQVTIPANQIGAHMLLDWGDTLQPTTCGKLNCDVDVWVAWDFNRAFAAGELYIGADDGNVSNGPAMDDPYPQPFVVDGRVNSAAKVWDLVSVDLAGGIYTAAGTTLVNLPLNNIPGIPMREGDNANASINFNLMTEDRCADAATRCNDNNACTKDICDPATGACSHTNIVCNDSLICTTDTCNPATGCVFTPKNCNDNNACTTDWCHPTTGNCMHTAIICTDNNICTTDTCSPATGCVFTNNTNACSDNNACTVNDHCSGGVCISGTTKVCPSGVCNSATGCPVTSVSTSGNNFTLIMANGYVLGGTNDVKFTWDGTLQNTTTFANGALTAPSNATITSDEPYNLWLWKAKHVQVVGPGTYWVDLDGAGPLTTRYEVTIPAGRIGAHMLFDWGDTGQATSCGKLNCDVDVWVAWDFNNAFATGKLFTGADDGTYSYGPANDDPYPLPFVVDGRVNASTKVWDLVSTDVAGRVTTSAGGTLKFLLLDEVPGLKLQDGSFGSSSINFNVMLQ